MPAYLQNTSAYFSKKLKDHEVDEEILTKLLKVSYLIHIYVNLSIDEIKFSWNESGRDKAGYKRKEEH